MATERDYSHRSTVQKLGVTPDQRVEIAGDVGPGLRRDVKEAIGRGLVRSGELDGAIVLVESEDEGKEALVRYRARLRDTGYLWVITRKRGHERYLNQMALVPYAKRLGLIDNKTCSIDEERGLAQTALIRETGRWREHRCPHPGADPAVNRRAGAGCARAS
jgi:hypothetical protein